jgi:hypothetical protein
MFLLALALGPNGDYVEQNKQPAQEGKLDQGISASILGLCCGVGWLYKKAHQLSFNINMLWSISNVITKMPEAIKIKGSNVQGLPISGNAIAL